MCYFFQLKKAPPGAVSMFGALNPKDFLTKKESPDSGKKKLISGLLYNSVYNSSCHKHFFVT